MLLVRRHVGIGDGQYLGTDPLAERETAVDGTSSRGTCRRVHVVAGTDLPEPALQRQQLLVNLQAGCERVAWRGSGRAAGGGGGRVVLRTPVVLVALGAHGGAD